MKGLLLPLRNILLGLLGVLIVVLLMDYFTAAELQVDLNAPRFRLVRERLLLPDQEFELEWKNVRRWSISSRESPPVFGQQTQDGWYAWEIIGIGMRFEDIYHEIGNLNRLRTNVVVFQLSTRSLPDHSRRFDSAVEWAKWYH